MSLVNYASSDDEAEKLTVDTPTSHPHSAKRPIIEHDEKKDALVSKKLKKLPPPKLPDQYKNERKELSEKRRLELTGRHIPFVRGNWTTMVYIKVPFTQELQTTTTNILKSMQHVVSGIKAIPLVEGDLHISLSRTLFLKEFQLDRFLELLKTQLSKSKQFGFSFSKLSKYENDEKTRSFLALDVGEGHQVLAAMVKKVDSVLSEFGFKTFYENPEFHASIVYADNFVFTDAHVFDLQSAVSPTLLRSFSAVEVHCRSGNKNFRIGLDR